MILWFDLSDSYGIVEGVAYIVLILLALMSGRIRFVYIMAVLGTVLVVAGYLITVESSSWWVVMINRGLALLTIWITAILGINFLRREINLRTLIDTTVDGIVTVDTRCRIRTFNSAARQIFGYRPDEVMNQDISMLLPGIHGDDQKSSIRRFLGQGGSRGVARGLEVNGLRKDGTQPVLELSVAEYEDGADVHFLLMIRDISERKQAEEKILNQQKQLEAANARLEALAIKDPLTELFNRRAFNERLTAEISHAVRYLTPLSIILIDIDHFKTINDSYGHEAGDEVLREFALRIKKSIRGLDLACRYGGEEFVIVMPETEMAVSAMVAERLRRRSRADWLAALEAAKVPCGPINDLDDVFADPQVRARLARATNVPGASERIEEEPWS